MTHRALAAAWLAATVVVALSMAGAGQPETGSAPLPERAFDNPARACFAHHAIEAAFDPATAGLQATDRIVLRHLPGVPARIPVPFLLHRDLQITEIAAAGAAGDCALGWAASPRWDPRDFWEQPRYDELAGFAHGREIALVLDGAAPEATWPESLLVVVRYEGTVYDSLRPPPENYQRGFETTTGLIDPRGVFLNGATLWYPQRFDEPFPFTLAVALPSGWQAISQGKRHAQDGRPDQVAWTSPAPMDEIYLVAGPYVMREEAHTPAKGEPEGTPPAKGERHGAAPASAAPAVDVRTFTYGNDDAELCRRYLDATHDYLDLYGRLIGPYPFPSFALVENFWQTGYGMPGFTLLGDRVIRLPFIVHTSYGHEILHNWWGNGVFVDYESGNWCEGLTVYGADYLYKERESAEAAREYRRTQLIEYRNYVRAGRDFPLSEFRERHDASSAAVGYGKAMMLYHMLRGRLGEGRFWRGLSAFYERFLFRRASWSDLLSVFAGGEDGEARMETTAFYEQWIARTGAPRLRLATTDLLPRGDDAFDLTYEIEQEAPCYSLEVPVRVTYESRPPETWRISLREGSVRDTRRLPAMPRTLAVDPDFDLFRELHPAEVPTVLSRLFSADSLTIAIAAGEPDSLREAARALDIPQTSSSAPVEAEAISLRDLDRGGAWIFGQPGWIEDLTRLLPDSVGIGADDFRIGETVYPQATHTLVLAVENPANPDEAIGLVAGGAASDLPAIWRKLPHYGKYSYLVFAGSGNVAKGIWEPGRSPLTMTWGGVE